MNGELEPVIGLEVHVQLKTATKLFCGCATGFGAEPNSNVCPVCLGLPGALPVLNRLAVELAARAAFGLQCTVHETSIFARKNYFYPDLPKGYQITQFDRPIATEGELTAPEADEERPVRIRRIHLEDDAGKSLHDRLPGRTAVDLNRAGTPLIEIVTEPDLHSPAQARVFLTRLKQILQYLDVSDCDMEKGSLRVDANVSVRNRGVLELGPKTELKNMNSFANVERALNFEIARQIALVERGERVVNETLLWDEVRGEARPMRSKEESHDYRYFPDPDLPPLVITLPTLERIRASVPELPRARAQRFVRDYAIPAYDAEVLTADRAIADYFEAVALQAGDAKAASNWIMTDVLGVLNDRGWSITEFPVSASALAQLINLVRDGVISHGTGRTVLGKMLQTGRSASEIVEAEGLAQVSDVAQLETWVRDVLELHQAEVERVRAGDQKVFGFLMGQVMKRSQGKADPRRATAILREQLGLGS